MPGFTELGFILDISESSDEHGITRAEAYEETRVWLDENYQPGEVIIFSSPKSSQKIEKPNLPKAA